MRRIDSSKIITYPLISEDSVKLIETENKIIFIVDLRAGKRDVQSAVEELYDVLVEKVNISITPDGLKKAYVKLKSEYNASDLAVKLGIL